MRKVLLIGWDAADWEVINPLVDAGLMPSLEGLINRGVMGNLASLQPMLSPMLWNSIATGKLPHKHGIHGFIEPDPIHGGARPYTSTSRKCKALWNILTQSGLRSNVIGWWASHPAEPINGTVVTNAFGGVKFDPEHGWSVPSGAIHPKEKSNRLAQFKVFPTELSAAHLLPFIPEAAKIDQRKSRTLGTFLKILSDAASIHAVATALMETEPWDFTAVYYDAVDHFSHAFMSYHPPRLEWVKEEEFELYKDVVAGAYRFHDMMLERLLQLAGPETTVILCSDHGFESGAQRPRGTPREPAGPANAHRQFGVVVIAGPGIKHDERIYGANLTDIAPTVLTLFDLPIGNDMDGRPLVEAFVDRPEIKTIPSWENVEGECGMHPPGEHIDADQAQELMQQFAALGYIEDQSLSKEKQAESAAIEASYNLARSHLSQRDGERARPLLEEIVRKRPWEDRFLHYLAHAYLQSGYLRAAEDLVTSISDDGAPQSASTRLLLARIKVARGDFGGALNNLRAAEELDPHLTGLHTQIGDLYAQLAQFDQAQRAYERAIAIDPENAYALQGLSSIFRRRGLNQETVDTALRALALLYRLPLAHFNLGVALARSGDAERAKLAFETALRFQPEMLNAHRYLALLHQQEEDGRERVAFHREEMRRIRRDRTQHRRQVSDRSEKVFDLPPIPGSQERTQILLRERPDPIQEAEPSGRTFILVSGLPRSGTSLMMQMLEAGGMKILTDGVRVADDDNPRGYYEWEAIKQIGRNPELLDDEALAGSAIKCISVLLPSMPQKHDYKVIFMTRPIEEVVRSQRRMVDRLGTKGAEADMDELKRGLSTHRNEIRDWIARAPHMEMLEVDFPALVANPAAVIAQIVEFLGNERLPRAQAMTAAVDPALYRKKAAAA